MHVYDHPLKDKEVRIDTNHALLVQALVTCKKPRQILELGFGSGEATRAILAGLRYNNTSFEYTVVDNWRDFAGAQPQATQSAEYKKIRFVTRSERDYVASCERAFDFIFSDADHDNAQLWFKRVYTEMLEPGGVLFYHDVTNPMFPGLFSIYAEVVRHNYNHILLDRSSVGGERCERGLLAIFKPAANQPGGLSAEK